ncbi:hypothetical protein [Candidatus Fokinia crypta]|uniref:Outer membrane protein beta-barrel domain-containing protein n=1 Tax=Candidatus Fokinia crypta TaxID=1920990 RepID=A0ABZ0UNE6_9RICK|nr:hypothetical protein [Candidatus Fokinia cryptica]WPX97644.1 hypothetical protein Fokcrypt_00153 [Candidatus Fokinia cryptica]
MFFIVNIIALLLSTIHIQYSSADSKIDISAIDNTEQTQNNISSVGCFEAGLDLRLANDTTLKKQQFGIDWSYNSFQWPFLQDKGLILGTIGLTYMYDYSDSNPSNWLGVKFTASGVRRVTDMYSFGVFIGGSITKDISSNVINETTKKSVSMLYPFDMGLRMQFHKLGVQLGTYTYIGSDSLENEEKNSTDITQKFFSLPLYGRVFLSF